MRLGVAFVLAVGVAVHPAPAQEVRGTVTDAATGVPIPSAVLLLLDSGRAVVGRNISGEGGRFRLALAGDGVRTRLLRVVRIGYRPLEFPLAAPLSGIIEVNPRMTALPTMLEPVRVLDQPNCPRRNDRPAAFALWEQAQTALLATVVAREANPAAMLLVGYQRTMDNDGTRIVRQTVRLDSAERSTVSFVALRTAAEFVKLGFVSQVQRGRTFLGPDADVLLDDDFLIGYCLRVADGNRGRPHQVGLAFEASGHVRDRIDIAGTFWLDTVARALREIEFRYVGLGRELESLNPGGHMEFREMPNGVVLLDRWTLRLVGADSVLSFRNAFVGLRLKPYAEEGGGELARATWPDGTTWRASLGRAVIVALRDDDSPAAGTAVRLDETGYQGIADSAGHIVISNLVPGPYSVVVADPRLAAIGVVIKTGINFVAARDSVSNATIVVPTAEQVVAGHCSELGRAISDSTRLLIRVLSADGAPVPGVTLSFREETSPDNWVALQERFETGDDGLLALCSGLTPGANIVVQSRHGPDRVDVPIKLKTGLTIAPIRFTRKP